MLGDSGMSNILQGKTLNSGADSPPMKWTFTRPTGDTEIDYTGAAIRLLVFPATTLKENALPTDANTPALTLSIGSGLTRETNTPSVQAGTLTFTSSQLVTLLGTANRGQYRFLMDVQPSGGSRFTSFVGEIGGYDGIFYVTRPGFAGVDPALVKAS